MSPAFIIASLVFRFSATQSPAPYIYTMENFQIVIFIMTILIVLSAFADKIKMPYPILLVLVGLIIGFVPALPNLELNPDIVFLVFYLLFCLMPLLKPHGMTLKKKYDLSPPLLLRLFSLLPLR